MIKIDEAKVDKMRLELLLSGHPFSVANRLAADMYLKEAIEQEKLERLRLAQLSRLPYNTASANRAKRPTQTAWRTAHANI